MSLLTRAFLMLALTSTLSACGSSSGSDDYESSDAYADAYADGKAEAQAAVETAVEEAGPEDVDAQEVESSGPFDCTQDCSGHEAGFVWAQSHDLTDESECRGDSASFVGGCEQFIEERQSMAEEQARETAEAAVDEHAQEYADENASEYALE